MSKKLFLLPTLLLGAFLLFTPSCTETDACKDLEGKCGNGQCFDGACVCDEGYEGTNCESEWSAKFVGSYLGTDKVTASTSDPTTVGVTYNLSKPAVATRKGADKISISNFGGFDSFVDVTISKASASDATAEKVTISFTDPTGRKFTGEGSYSSGKIRGTYRVVYGDNTYDDNTFEYNKQ